MNEQSPHTDIVNDWIIGYLTNSLTPEEMQSLQNWLNVSEENRKYFSDMQEVWIAASDEADERSKQEKRRKDQGITGLYLPLLCQRFQVQAGYFQKTCTGKN